MPSFYNIACRVNAKLAFYQRELQVSVLDDNLNFYVPKGDDYQLTLPKSIMNENVAVNYRTIYNGYLNYSKKSNPKANEFTMYDDYKKCISDDNFYNMYLQDKQNPTYKNILKYYSSKTFDPYGLAAYRMQDFIYLKYYNQIPNNYMITLRRYTLPCEDHMFGLDMNSVDVNHLNGYNESHINIATAVTYMGDKTGNKLSDILKFEYGADYEEKIAKVEMLQNTDGGLAAQMSKRFGGDESFMRGEQNIFDGAVGDLLKNALTFSAATQGKGQDVAQAQTANNRFQGNEWAHVYGENLYGDVNVIDRVKIRSRGLKFNGDFTLNFEYSLKSLKCVNPRVAMMDILTNFLILTGNYGAFWGGETRFYGQRSIAPQYGDTASLRDGDYKGFWKSLVDDFRQGWSNITTANGGDGSFWSGLQNLAGGALKGLFGNLLGGNIGVAGQAQAPIALLSGKPTGYWHVTIGNPLDPIAMIGNLGVTSTTVQFSDVLGYDDFPTEVKFTVKLQHCIPRDNAAIENMFNGAKGRIYAFTDSNVLRKFENVDNKKAYQDYANISRNQETNMYFDDKGNVIITDNGEGRPMTPNMMKVIGTAVGS